MSEPLKKALIDFYPFAKKQLGFNRPPRLFLRNDHENAKNVLGSTAHYDPEREFIVLYITNRHPKDVLRSFAHELVHHAQNCRGQLGDMNTSMGYAQSGKGEKLEKEAYLGTKMVRDWEDSIKIKGAKQMSESKKINKETIERIVTKVISEVVKEEMAKEKKKAELEKQLAGVEGSHGVSKAMNKSEKEKIEKELSDLEEEKKKMPDKNKDGIPDFAQDGKGKNDLGKGKSKSKKKKGGKIPSQLEPFVKGKKKKDKEKVDEKYDDDVVGAQTIGKEYEKAFKAKKKKDKEKKKPEGPSGPAYPGDEHFYGYDDQNYKYGVDPRVKYESKQQDTKEVINEKPKQQEQKVDNDSWYWGSLYEKLKDKWTK